MSRRAAIILFLLSIISCSPPSSPSVDADNGAVERAFADHRSGIEVTARGAVERLLADERSDTGDHQRFILRLDQSTRTLLITNNVSIGKRVPVALGDELTVHGEYIWNEQGGLVHFTHHDPQRTHESGWIERQGVRYE